MDHLPFIMPFRGGEKWLRSWSKWNSFQYLMLLGGRKNAKEIKKGLVIGKV